MINQIGQYFPGHDRLFSFLLCAVLSSCYSCTQHYSLPEPVTNNAVAALLKDARPMLYSFYGLDSTKRWSGVHKRVYRLDIKAGISHQIGNVPDEHGRLASAASAIKNRAYVAGGYAILGNGKEKSSNHLFIFNPETEQFTTGAKLPVPIDDQMQSVWRDSLLYVISGWSDSVTVNTVQLYYPIDDQWQLATALPDEHTATVFGGCALIVGDTIYTLGGAMFGKFYPPSRGFYKGAIDPRDPAHVTWLRGTDYPGEFRYRSAAYASGNTIYFFGGSHDTYNYNGISYREKKPVVPNQTVLSYDIRTGMFSVKLNSQPAMDLRNIPSAMGKFWIVGGMGKKQKVSRSVMEVR